MAKSEIWQVLCLGMLASFTGVMAGFDVGIYIAGDYVHNVDDKTLNRTDGTITVTREAVDEFKCVKDERNDQVVLSTLENKVKAKEMKIEVLFGGGHYEFGTITKVEPVYPSGFGMTAGLKIHDFKFTYSLDAHRTEWSPCVFGYNYFGFKNINTRHILLTCTQDVIDDLISRSAKDWICMSDINADGNAYAGYPDYVIRSLEKKSDKDVHGDIKAYILSYSAISKLELI